MKYISFLVIILISGNLFSQKKMKDGYELITAMNKKYEGGKKWYKNLTFTQDISFYKNGKEEKKEVWYEALNSPGNLIIKFGAIDGKNGVIFTNQRVLSIRDGKPTEPKPFIHDLLLMGFDVYFLKPTVATHLLDSLGYNLKIIRADTFETKKVYVVGAQKNDSVSNQFWISAEHLFLYRIIYKKSKNIQDVIFGNYEKLENNWVAKTITFKNNGFISAIEKYYDIKFPKELNGDLFKPEKFLEAKW